MNEEKLIGAIRRRDEAAIHAAIDKYSRLLWKVAEAALGDAGTAQDVEECVADAFIRLWQAPEQYDPQRGSLKTWLSIVARSRALDRRRALLKQSTVPLEEAVPFHQIGLADRLLAQDDRRTLAAAVRALEEPDREILVRRYYHDQKPRQIALALGLTVKQVDNHLYRTKRKLRDTLSHQKEVSP